MATATTASERWIEVGVTEIGGVYYCRIAVDTQRGPVVEYYTVGDEISQYRFLKDGPDGEVAAEYVVKVGPRGPWHCSCPDARYRARTCKHQVAAVEVGRLW